MEVSRKTYSEIISILKTEGGIEDASKCMEVANKLCELFENLQPLVPASTEAFIGNAVVPGVSTTPGVGRGSKRVLTPTELAEAQKGAALKVQIDAGAGPRKGRPGQQVDGGYFDKNGDFVPTGRPLTSAMPPGATVAPESDEAGNIVAPAR